MPLLLTDRATLRSPLSLATFAEAQALGIRLDDGSWRRLRKGVYVDRLRYEALPPWKRYAARVHAYLLVHPDAVVCLESAAVLHGLPAFGEPRHIHVYDPEAKRSQGYGDVRVHTSRDERTLERVGVVLVTSLLDTTVDLVRLLAPAEGLAVADAALSPVQGGVLRLDDVRDRAHGQGSGRGRARMRWVCEHADPRSESPHESVSRAVMLWAGYEEPELQRSFWYEGHEDRVDFYFPGCRGIGEADGWEKYRLGDAEEAAQKLAAEKRREDRLRRQRHPFARWEPRDVWQPNRLCSALDGAGIPRVRAPQPLMLETLRRHPRSVIPR